MKNAIILYIYKNPHQVNRLIEQLLSSTNDDIYVHINKLYDGIRTELVQNDRVYVTRNNIPAVWYSDGLFLAIIQMLKEVIESRKEYNHVLMISGQDMLVRDGLDDYLEKHREQIFFDVRKDNQRFARAVLLYKWPSIYKHNWQFKYHPMRILRSLRIRILKLGIPFRRKKIVYDTDSIEFYHNTFWGSMPFVVAKWIIDFLNKNSGFEDIYKGAILAEEKFLGTLFMMSPYKDWVKFDTNNQAHSLTFTYKVVNNHVPALTMSDIPEIEKSEAFFARKIDPDVDMDFINYYYKKFVK